MLSKNVQDYSKFHAAIKKLLWTIPTSAPVLAQAIRKEMPYQNAYLIHQTRYVSNILTIMDYCPALRESIFNCIVDLIIQIDVEIQVDEDEEESNEEEMISIFKMDEKKATMKKAIQQFKTENSLNLARVDFLMIIVMEWFNSKDEEEKEEMFQYMLTSFDRSIVTTYKSKYTQFLIFYMCKQGTTYVDRFLNYLTQRYLNYTLSNQIRQAAASYIGSFVCRAKYLTQNIVRKTVGYLTSWLHCYIDLKGNDEPDVDKHGIFYSLCQALLFIFCFKKTLLIGQDDKFVHNLALDRIVRCNLNPLKFLIKDVIKEFSSICEDIKLMNCKPIIQANKKLPKQKKLETFFPFDPINLRQTSLLINPIYQEWDDNDDEEETEGNNDGMPIPNSLEYMNEGGSLSESFEDNMSFGNSFNNSLEMSYT